MTPAEHHQVHDHLVRRVFSETEEAAALLRVQLPERLNAVLDWPTLTLRDGSYVDDDLRASQSDLLFEVQWRPGAGGAHAGTAGEAPQPLLVYVLLEHQSTPDRWMSFRLLEYCMRIWADRRRADRTRSYLPPIVPVVLYQGKDRWSHAREFAALFTEAVREWPWTPRFEHVLIDQSQATEREVRGGVAGCAAQLVLMAAVRPLSTRTWAALLLAVAYLRELARSGRSDLVGVFVTYVIATQDEATVQKFGREFQRQVPGPGGDMKTYAEVLREEGLQRGLQRGRQEGQLVTIEGFLRAGVGWPIIEVATGIDEEAFQALRQQREASDPTAG